MNRAQVEMIVADMLREQLRERPVALGLCQRCRVGTVMVGVFPTCDRCGCSHNVNMTPVERRVTP